MLNINWRVGSEPPPAVIEPWRSGRFPRSEPSQGAGCLVLTWCVNTAGQELPVSFINFDLFSHYKDGPVNI